jgi:hypothetical protein
MKTLLAAAAAVALIAAAAPVPAQTYQMGAYPWMMDDGSSSDFPIHNPGDISGDRLNAQYLGGIDVAPPNGFPAPYRLR